MNMKRIAVPLILVLVFLAGGVIAAYPVVSNLLYEKNQSYVLTEYDETVEQVEKETLDAELQAAQEYNHSLLESEAVLIDPFAMESTPELAESAYDDLLNLEQNGIMGYLEIPKLSVTLPIYHGTSAQVLEQGVGHMQGTSLPVGGESTHTVLTGHTGLPGKRLFTDLPQLEEGDVFYLHVLENTLAYQVEKVYIVEPDQTEHLVVETGQDLATLITCYPYGINTHRLLVQGIRIPYEQVPEQQWQSGKTQKTNTWKLEYQKALIICLAIYIPLTAIAVLILSSRRKKRRRRKRKQESQDNKLVK